MSTNGNRNGNHATTSYVQANSNSFPSSSSPSTPTMPNPPSSSSNSRISQSTLSPYSNSTPTTYITHHPPEQLVIVRPPPSKANHPLNLQIQILAPPLSASSTGSNSNSNNPARRASGDWSSNKALSESGQSFDAVATATVGVEETGEPLRRTASVRSNRSTRSGSSSMGSQNGSSIGPGSGHRRVTPLYNLEFHAVLTTVVTDAGTDAKVAKFLKKGVEILNLAIIDPIEPSSASLPRPSTSSETTREIIQPAPPTSSPSFMKALKRLSFKPPPSPTTSSPSLQTPTVIPLFRTNSLESGSTSSLTPSLPTTNLQQSQKKYVWIIRKWLRKDLEGTKAGQKALQSLRFEWTRLPKQKKKKPRGDSSGVGNGSGGRMKRSPTLQAQLVGAGSPPSSSRLSHDALRSTSPYRQEITPPLLTGEESTVDPNRLVPIRSKRPTSIIGPAGGSTGARTPDTDRSRSPGLWSNSSNSLSDLGHEEAQSQNSHRPPSTTIKYSPPIPTSTSTSTSSNGNGNKLPDLETPSPPIVEEPFEIDEGTESDPEDSERQWICELIYTSSTSSTSSSSERRILLGTLTPAPHHPKLVAHLAIPFSLSPIPLGGFEAGRGMANQGLSVEEMKDVVNVTCLWVVVRESLGGLGKRRKGDGGWRIR